MKYCLTCHILFYIHWNKNFKKNINYKLDNYCGEWLNLFIISIFQTPIYSHRQTAKVIFEAQYTW